MTKTEAKVCEILSGIQKKKGVCYDTDALFDLLGISSVEFIELIVKLEEEFQLEFEDEMLQLDKIKTIKMISEYVDRVLTGR